MKTKLVGLSGDELQRRMLEAQEELAQAGIMIGAVAKEIVASVSKIDCF